MQKRYVSLLMTICLLGITGCGQAVAGVAATTESSTESVTESGADSTAGTTDTAAVASASQDVFAMDTYMTVTAYGTEATEAVTAAVTEIERLEGLFSTEVAGSDIYKINHEERAVVSDDTMTVLGEALQLYHDTEGAFDMTIYPVMQAWGFTTGDYTVLTDEMLASLLEKVDVASIDLDQKTNTVTITHEGTELDLGGIAKGYTSARLMTLFDDYDLVSGMVNLGGNVQVYAAKPDGSDWRVAIQDPENTEDYIGVVATSDAAVITSGGYERYFEADGVTYHHIIDPSTGKPADSGLISATIVSRDGMLADGLSTSVFIMGKERATTYWEQNKDKFDMILVENDGSITVTSGLSDTFTSEQSFEMIE